MWGRGGGGSGRVRVWVWERGVVGVFVGGGRWSGGGGRKGDREGEMWMGEAARFKLLLRDKGQCDKVDEFVAAMSVNAGVWGGVLWRLILDIRE